LPSKVQIKVTAGQRLKIETPGGGAVGQKKL
jgi:N-methylhydantoinase B/oxoprolinase/acetone carboxylase alpha subunit